MLCGLPPALSVTDSAAARAPAAPGVKVTPTLQVAPGATEAPVQVSVAGGTAKSPALAPVGATAVMASGARPVFVTVAVCAVLVTPTSWLAKATGELPNAGMIAAILPVTLYRFVCAPPTGSPGPLMLKKLWPVGPPTIACGVTASPT